MTTFTETINDNEVECPYCHNTYQPEASDYTEETHIEECEECGKKYYTHQIYSVYHKTQPDCELNGGEHNYQMIPIGSGMSHPFCTICDKCQPHTELKEGE